MNELGAKSRDTVYINAGAGDLFFDKILLRRYKKTRVHAIDNAYEELVSQGKRIHRYRKLEDIEVNDADYAIMMDSLEYMEDDVEYVRKWRSGSKKADISFLRCLRFPVCSQIMM